MSKEFALSLAAKYNLEHEVNRELENGASPAEALMEWDLL